VWLFIRLAIIPVVMILYSFFKKNKNFKNNQKFKNDEIIEEIQRNKHRTPVQYSYYLQSSNRLVFTLKPETLIENFFKQWGLTNEYSVDHTEFDQKIFIECDDPTIVDVLKKKELIKDILELFRQNISLKFNDGYLVLYSKNALTPEDQEILYQIRDAIDQAKLETSQIQKTLIFTKLTIVETFMWVIASQGIIGIIEMMANLGSTLYESKTTLLLYSLALWVILILSSLYVIRIILGASATNVYAVLELLCLGIFCYPPAAVSITSDYNINFDQSTPNQVEYRLLKHREVVHHRKRSTSYSYYFDLARQDQSQYTIEVPFKLYQSVEISRFEQTKVLISYGKGRLNIPWIKEISVLNPKSPYQYFFNPKSPNHD
jgi:hypothetical protein